MFALRGYSSQKCSMAGCVWLPPYICWKYFKHTHTKNEHEANKIQVQPTDEVQAMSGKVLSFLTTWETSTSAWTLIRIIIPGKISF